MSLAGDVKAPDPARGSLLHRRAVGAALVDATIKVIDSGTEELCFSVAEAQAAGISRAAGAAREAFDSGPRHGRPVWG
jgi:acyl-CoA reductase-like NAD-dependent aldehyde dehydrogenase